MSRTLANGQAVAEAYWMANIEYKTQLEELLEDEFGLDPGYEPYLSLKKGSVSLEDILAETDDLFKNFTRGEMKYGERSLTPKEADDILENKLGVLEEECDKQLRKLRRFLKTFR